MLKLTH